MGNEPGLNDGRWLERALLFTFVAHLFAMLTMVLFLIPALPGGMGNDVGERIAYVADHPWLLRFGWFGWQVTALSDLLLSLALVVTPWISKWAAGAALVLTIFALFPDQIHQWLWDIRGPGLAGEALASGNLSAYLEFERSTFLYIAGWGPVGYLSAAIAWTWAFAGAGIWSRGLFWLSVVTWSVFGLATGGLFVIHCTPHQSVWPDRMVSAGNAIAFVLLVVWIAWVGELVFRRSRPETEYGRNARWRYPGNGFWGGVYNLLANSRFFRALCEYSLTLAMASGITDVVYVNYLVDAERLARFVPAPLEIQRLGKEGEYALFSILTYRHGHFGPRVFGPLRRLWSSPIQSNWRLYVVDPQTKLEGVYFLTTAITSPIHALAARMLSEGVPMHIPAVAELQRRSDEVVSLALKTGVGTAPDLVATLHFIGEIELPFPWDGCFDSWQGMLRYCVPQDRALNIQPWYNRVTRQEIHLGVPLETCRPLDSQVISSSVELIAGDGQPICFYVPKVRFLYRGEEYDPRKDQPGIAK